MSTGGHAFRRRAQMNGEDMRIIYNRVPKCGSRTVNDVLRLIAEKGGLTWEHCKNFTLFRMTKQQQVHQIKDTG